jgi:acyl carrier protein
MTLHGVQDVRAVIVSMLHQPLSASGFDAATLPDDFDFRARGVIDSLGFIQLLGALEVWFGGPIDLADVPPEGLTTIGMLSRHVAAQVTGQHVTGS